MSDSPYDEVGSRTRQAWQRTSLGIVAVMLLAVRSLLLDRAGPVIVLAAVAPAVAFVVVALLRMADLRHREAPAAVRPVVLAASASVAGLAVMALIGVLAVSR